MSSQHIGIEEARKVLGDLVTAAQQGTDIILTRNRRPVARIIPYLEDAMDQLAARFDAQISDSTKAAIANVVEHTIEREHGIGDDTAARGARLLALAGIKMDARDLFVEVNGSDRGLDGFADAELRVLVNRGLEARRCQCQVRHLPARLGHGHIDACERHYEADVPPLDGLLLCGTCHIAEHQARS